MAIEKMKKLRLMAVRPQKAALFRELLRLGAIEIAELELTEDEKNALEHENSEAVKLKGQYALIMSALRTLDAHAHLKDPLLRPKPLIAAEELLSADKAAEAIRIAEEIERNADVIKRANAEISRQKAVAEALVPWLPLDIPLELTGTETTAVITGTIPTDYPFSEVTSALEKASELSELFSVSSDDKLQYTVLVCHKDELAAALTAVRAFSFAVASFSRLRMKLSFTRSNSSSSRNLSFCTRVM